MCGIALIVSGVSICGADCCRETLGDLEEVQWMIPEVEDFEAALSRRGPDSFGCRKVLVCSNGEFVVTNDDDKDENGCSSVASQAAADVDVGRARNKSVVELCFLGAMLQLRGTNPVSQPLVAPSGNLLIYNGEIFGGLAVADDKNDSECLLDALETCSSCDCNGLDNACSCTLNGGKSVPEVLSTIRGPWALIYWQRKSKTIWFGRDAFGRRSLLIHWPTSTDSRFILSSVSPHSSSKRDVGTTSTTNGHEPKAADGFSDLLNKSYYWEELPCGIYSVNLKDLKTSELSMKKESEVRKHEWRDPLLNGLIAWERSSLVPKVELSLFGKKKLLLPSINSDDVCQYGDGIDNCTVKLRGIQLEYYQPAYKVLVALRESILRRTVVNRIPQGDLLDNGEDSFAPIAVLFSGGLDSMILAALLDQCLNSKYTIDLLNVSFDGQLAPDRVSALSGLKELQKISPLRRWRLVEIDTALSNLTWENEHVMSLIHPSKTYMDLNIGIALWLAASGDGWVNGKICDVQEVHQRYKYKSTSRILLVGSGADEQCAGYGRHRTKYRIGGWIALHEEMRLDVQRIWKRNMGRDDRCISDNGKEARFPFLDEDVIRTLLEIPLWEIAELDEPVGRGDKKVLREVAKLLGLEEAAHLPKRAIQFGSRIARESNRKNFGSNRAANQASAGGVEIHQHAQVQHSS